MFNAGILSFFLKWGTSLGVLLAGTLLLRRLTVGKITPSWQSLLWLPLLLRLLIPVAGPFKIEMDMQTLQPLWLALANTERWLRKMLHITPEDGGELTYFFLLVAIMGIVLFALWFGIGRLIFEIRLRRHRRPMEVENYGLRVYVSEAAEAPCLVGLWRPAVYLPAAVAENEKWRRYALTHEWVHFRHGDHIRAFLRTVLLILHWYNPLIWAAILRMKRDSEAACDAGVIRILGEENRREYGEVLLELTVRRRGTAIFVNGMSDRAAALRQRLHRLVAPRHHRPLAVVASVLVVVLMVGCFFVPEGRYSGKITLSDGTAQTVAEEYTRLFGERIMTVGPLHSHGALDYKVTELEVISCTEEEILLSWRYGVRTLEYGWVLAGDAVLGTGEEEGWIFHHPQARLQKQGELWVEDAYGHVL